MSEQKIEFSETIYQVVWKTEFYLDGQKFYDLKNAQEYYSKLKKQGFDKNRKEILGNITIDKIVETRTRETIFE